MIQHFIDKKPDHANLIGVAFSGDPAKGKWGNTVVVDENKAGFIKPKPENNLNYFITVSCFKNNRRVKDDFVAMMAVMVDDVGTKVDADKITLEPSYIFETSPGNLQYWYVFKEPLEKYGVAVNLVNAMVDMGLTVDGKDPGMKGVTRLGRFGNGINGKAKYKKDGKPFREKVVGDAGLEYTPEEIVEGFGLDPEKALCESVFGGVGGGSVAGVNSEITQFAMTVDELGKFLIDQGLVKQYKANGFVDITCPWVDEHTGGDDTGTAYIPADIAAGRGGFQCHHGHCQDRTVEDLRDWAESRGWKGYDDEQPEVKARKKELKKSAKTRLQRLEQRYCYIESLNKFYNRASGAVVSVEAVNMMNPIPVRTAGPNGVVEMSLTQYILRHGPKTCRASRSSWHPGRPNWFKENGHSYCNIWQGVKVKASSVEPTPWLDHVKRIYPDDWEHIIQWLAFTVQKPEEKINHALVLGGTPGLGKDTILAPVVDLPGFGSNVDMKRVMGDFQGWYYQSKLIVIQEAKRSTRHAADDVHNTLKPFLTNPPHTIKINRKNVAEEDIPNLGNIAIVTNYDDALHVDEEERRYYVAFTKMDPVKDLGGDDYFRPLWRFLNEGGSRQVCAWLLQYDLAGFSPTIKPRVTDAQLEMRENSYNFYENTVREIIDKDQAVEVKALYDEIMMIATGLVNWSEQRVSLSLKGIGWVKVPNPTAKDGRWQKRIGGRNHTVNIWAHPENKNSLLQAQKLLNDYKPDFEEV